VCVNQRVTVCRTRPSAEASAGDGNCRGEIVKRCVLRQRSVCDHVDQDREDEGAGGANCTIVDKEICSLKPVAVEKLQRGRACRAQPIRACRSVPIKMCRNKCIRDGRALLKRAFLCQLAPKRQCVKVRSDASPFKCPPSSCRPSQVEVCSTRVPGCAAIECKKFRRQRCRAVSERRCPPPDCRQLPIRKCQPCQTKRFCHQHEERACRRQPRSECHRRGEGDVCSPKCSRVFLCPVCRDEPTTVLGGDPIDALPRMAMAMAASRAMADRKTFLPSPRDSKRLKQQSTTAFRTTTARAGLPTFFTRAAPPPARLRAAPSPSPANVAEKSVRGGVAFVGGW